MKNCYLRLKKNLLLFIIICFSLSLKGQTIKKDSLVKYSFEELSEKFYTAKPDSLKAVLYAKYYINKATREKDTLQTGDGYYYLSDITNDSTYFVNYWKEIIIKTKESNNLIYPTKPYVELGDFHLQRGRYNIALDNYFLAKYFSEKNRNDSLYYKILFRISIIKKKDGKYYEAINLMKKTYNYFNLKKESKLNPYNNDYYSLLLQLSSSYNLIKQYESAIFYAKKAQNLSLKFKDSILYGYTLYIEGEIKFLRKNYSESIKAINKSLPYIIKDNNYTALSRGYNYLAKIYKAQNIEHKAIKYFIKIDSLKESTNILHKSQKEAYKYLILHYKENENDKKQLEYINKYIKVDSVLNARSKNISKNLTDNYDIPNLIAEKKVIENKLKESLSTTKKWILAIALLSTLLLVFLIHQIRKRKLYKRRFKQVVNSSTQVSKQKEENIPKRENSIPKVTVKNILNLLQLFENKHHYISSETTLSSLAKNFETNSRYLSQVINQHKGQSFNNYVNSLRIDYTVKKLKSNSLFRKYSIKAIANEVGFNTAESFSKAFYKNTGIKPSFFIKELERK